MKNNMIIYVSNDGDVKVDISIENETIWMSQDAMANLYDTTKNNISMHLKNIFDDEKLQKDSVVKKFLTTAKDNKKYHVLHYNLDAIIAVGYRINSKKATEFRIWATKVLKEYMIKGFVLNDEKLKNTCDLTEELSNILKSKIISKSTINKIIGLLLDHIFVSKMNHDKNNMELNIFLSYKENVESKKLQLILKSSYGLKRGYDTQETKRYKVSYQVNTYICV